MTTTYNPSVTGRGASFTDSGTGLDGPNGPVILTDHGPLYVLSPSGDTSGATDYANVSYHIQATVGHDVFLTEGSWYFNNVLVRMPRRNAENTDWVYNTGLGINGANAVMPDFYGAGKGKTFLHFTDVNNCGMYMWRPPVVPAAQSGFTGAIVGTTLTINISKTLTRGQYLTGAGVLPNTYITATATGTSFTVSRSQTIAAGTAMTTTLGPSTNTRVRAGGWSDNSTDPYAWGGGITQGFTLIGAANPVLTTGNSNNAISTWSLENEGMFPNHIGLAVWGTNQVPTITDVGISYFDVGMMCHDTTGGTFNINFSWCNVGLGVGTNSDQNDFSNCTFWNCRVGISLAWDGWQSQPATGTGGWAAGPAWTDFVWTPIGLEFGGVYSAWSSNDIDLPIFFNNQFAHCTQAAIAGHANISNTVAADIHELKFDHAYFELNAMIQQGFRSNNALSVDYQECNFRGFTTTNYVGAWAPLIPWVAGGTNTGALGSFPEMCRHWIAARIGLSQSSTDVNFGQINMSVTGAQHGQITLSNNRMDECPYLFLNAAGSGAEGISINWKHNDFFSNGSGSYSNITGNLYEGGNAKIQSSTAGTRQRFMVGNTGADFGDYIIQNGYMSNGMGIANQRTVAASTDSPTTRDGTIFFGYAGPVSVTLPTTSSTPNAYRGKILRLITTATQSTNAVTSASANVVQMDGTTTSALFSADEVGKWTDLQFNGTAWQIIGQN